MVVDKNEDVTVTEDDSSSDNEDENESSITVEFSDEGNIADINTDGVTVTSSENPVVAMNIKDYGTVVIELYPDVAPISVENFVNLVESGFYDGITFHRVIEGFMIQGGDPDGDGIGGSDEQIKGEFYANGVENNLSHERGVISMARSNDYNSASSQFFIMHADYTSLDGQYAAFGKVISGMDVVDAIAACEVDSSNPNSPKPIVDIVMEKVVVDLNSYEAE
ncbi:MAG: peptidylprolyl isomerase [Clostridia bacterium]|nr:peptidylprolyl isomerase [Clostridia bacterium]